MKVGGGKQIAGAIVLALATAVQLAIIIFFWRDFDERLSCDRLPGWWEWLDCMHGISHVYVLTIEYALAAWLAAAIAWIAAKLVPPLLSLAVPLVAVLLLAWSAVGFWDETVTPYTTFGRPDPDAVLAYSVAMLAIGLHVVGPVIGAWLLGLAVHARRRIMSAG